MRRVTGCLIAAMLCAGASSRAQDYTISGGVVSSDGKALSMAFVALDSSKIITRVDSTGHYLLVVPQSIAHGQPEGMQAMAQGHIHTRAVAKLVGTAVVQNFVLQVDTMPEHRRMHPMLSDGKTEKSATDITIAGRVTDSAGARMPTAMVSLDPGGFRAMTNDSGFYSLAVPAGLRGRTVLLTAALIGFARTSDSLLLADEITMRDFVLRKRIYSGKAVPLDLGSMRAMGLTDLRTGPHRRSEREIRIRMDEGYASSSLFRLVNRSGRVSGELISFFAPRDDEDSTQAVGRVRPIHECTNEPGSGMPCRVRFEREPNWSRIWRTLDSLDIWNIVDEGSLRRRWSLVFDGSEITAELWDGNSYKAWAYVSGVEDDGPGRAKVSAISHLLVHIGSPGGP